MSDRSSNISVLSVALWAVLLVMFMAIRPVPHSWPFWLMIGAAILSGGFYMFLSHRESRRTQRATSSWLQRVNELVDVHDFSDDGHLPEYLDDAERQRVITELEQMPAGSRSLKRALSIVSPELIDEDEFGREHRSE